MVNGPVENIDLNKQAVGSNVNRIEDENILNVDMNPPAEAAANLNNNPGNAPAELHQIQNDILNQPAVPEGHQDQELLRNIANQSPENQQRAAIENNVNLAQGAKEIEGLGPDEEKDLKKLTNNANDDADRKRAQHLRAQQALLPEDKIFRWDQKKGMSSLAGFDVRNTDISDYSIEVVSKHGNESIVKISDFILKASEKEIKKVLPGVIYQEKEENGRQPTIFAKGGQQKDVLDKLAKISKEWDGTPANGEKNLADYKPADDADPIHENRWDNNPDKAKLLNKEDFQKRLSAERDFIESKKGETDALIKEQLKDLKLVDEAITEVIADLRKRGGKEFIQNEGESEETYIARIKNLKFDNTQDWLAKLGEKNADGTSAESLVAAKLREHEVERLRETPELKDYVNNNWQTANIENPVAKEAAKAAGNVMGEVKKGIEFLKEKFNLGKKKEEKDAADPAEVKVENAEPVEAAPELDKKKPRVFA
jgi:hypothetical protein